MLNQEDLVYKIELLLGLVEKLDLVKNSLKEYNSISNKNNTKFLQYLSIMRNNFSSKLDYELKTHNFSIADII